MNPTCSISENLVMILSFINFLSSKGRLVPLIKAVIFPPGLRMVIKKPRRGGVTPKTSTLSRGGVLGWQQIMVSSSSFHHVNTLI